MTLEAYSYSVVNPTLPLTPEQLVYVEAEKAADRAALVEQMANKVLEILLMNTNIQTAATQADVEEIVALSAALVKEDAAVNTAKVIEEVKKK